MVSRHWNFQLIFWYGWNLMMDVSNISCYWSTFLYELRNISQNFWSNVSNRSRSNFIRCTDCDFTRIGVNIDRIFICFFNHFNWLMCSEVIPACTSVYIITSTSYYYCRRMRSWYFWKHIKIFSTQNVCYQMRAELSCFWNLLKSFIRMIKQIFEFWTNLNNIFDFPYIWVNKCSDSLKKDWFFKFQAVLDTTK